MLSAKDFAEHGPDERAVILYVAFLCSRLLECSKDDRAAHIIQTAWRQAKAKTAGKTQGLFDGSCDHVVSGQGPSFRNTQGIALSTTAQQLQDCTPVPM